ncbi:hypothetical protein D3C80_1627120 [compost metagenome]
MLPAAPVLSMASATGSMAPSNTITGQSIAVYRARGGTMPSTAKASAPPAKATTTGSRPLAAAATLSAITRPASSAWPCLGTRMSRAASGRQPNSPAKPASASLPPCISSTSPARSGVARRRWIMRRP